MRVVALTHVFPRTEDDPSAPFLLTWARGLRDHGIEAAVVAPHDAGLPTRHRVAGVPVRRARYASDDAERLAYRGEMHQLVRERWGPPTLAALVASLAWALRSVVTAGRADVVHVHWWVPGMLAARLAALDVPVVCTVHGTDVAMVERRPAVAPLARWALAGADRIEAVSSDLATRLGERVGLAANAVAPMPLSDDALAATPAPRATRAEGQPLQILAAGRLVPEKGFTDLIAAVARLQTPAQLVVVGDGPERDALHRQAAAEGVALGLPGRLAPPALRQAYARADVVAVPSHREGLGLVACEAACVGTPVVATDSGGARDLLDPETLVPVGDPDAFAAAIAEVAADPAAARHRAAAVAERVRTVLSPAAAAERARTAYRAVGVG